MPKIPFVEQNAQPNAPLLHFAHANGYPPQAYEPFLESLGTQFHVTAMEARPLWPGTHPREVKDWGGFVGDLISFVETLPARAGKPIVGVGHSLGGAVSLMAAIQRPDLFRALVLIDPPFFPPRASLVWQVIYRLGLPKYVHPLIKGALKRRTQFESAQAMFLHYRGKKVFAKLDERALWAYVNALAVPSPKGGVQLRYSPAWEAHVYATGLLHDWKTWRNLRGFALPILLLRPEIDPTTPDETADLLQKIAPQTICRTIPNTTHLAPLEAPDEVAEMVMAFVDGVQN